jgi:hypothetical protein
MLYMGHGGDPCPKLLAPDEEGWQDEEILVGGDDEEGWQDEEILVSGDDEEGQDEEILVGGDRLNIGSISAICVRRIRWCQCVDEHGQIVPHDIQLLRMQLYPATDDNPRTAFTFELLRDFQLQATECKTAALNYLAKLTRQTNKLHPWKVPVSFVALISLTPDPEQEHLRLFYEMLPAVAKHWKVDTCWIRSQTR